MSVHRFQQGLVTRNKYFSGLMVTKYDFVEARRMISIFLNLFPNNFNFNHILSDFGAKDE